MRVVAEVDVHDMLEELDSWELDLLERALKARAASGEKPTGDPDADKFVEQAYLVAKAMPACPPAFRDLLWRVHGRAI